ncbi:MAG: diguanylate cyclase [Desulfovibrio sp.]|nr:diguanylate cyclase [Desulfovibrio sp.]
MRITHFVRDMASLILGVLAASMAIFFVSQHFMSEGFEKEFHKEMITMRAVVDEFFINTRKHLYQEALLISDSSELEKALMNKNIDRLTAFANTAVNRSKASFAVILDAEGAVLVRAHAEKLGDDIREIPIVQDALSGNSTVDVARFPGSGLSVAAASPIVVNNKVSGVILFGISFKDNEFVDEIQRITNLEMTIFDHDKRISTTIIRDGKRAINTRLDNPEIENRVLKLGSVYDANASILGLAYKTVYWPLKDETGSILGIWFIGSQVEHAQRTITTIAISCLLATLLIAAILSCLGVFFFRSLIAPLRKKAYVDKLTGITNRAGFDKRIKRLFETGRSERAGGLFLIDLDNFKTLNDTLGHPVGDECLKRTGGILKDIFRETDVIARLGGDEFVVYAPTLDAADVITKKLDILLMRLSQVFSADGKSVRVTASIGVATSHDGNVNYERMYTVADTALYSSKEGGRNMYTILCCVDPAEEEKDSASKKKSEPAP